MPFRVTPILLALTLGGYFSNNAAANVNLADTSQIITINATPNILLIPDTSKTMQEGLSQGRIALNWDDTACRPGTNMPARCVAGAKYTDSKASIVKRVGLNLVDNFSGRVNMGLLSYQQFPPSRVRNDAFNKRTVLWFLTHRPIDVRYATTASPTWYNPNHTGRLDSAIKRFREPHPTVNGVWMFYNVAVSGYYIAPTDSNFPPQVIRNMFAKALNNYSCNNTECSPYELYNNMSVSRRSINYTTYDGRGNFTFTDSMRGRGVRDFGAEAAFLYTPQLEWRANDSPGPGYLHVPIGGIDQNGKPITAHWQKIKNKLQPQRTDWNGTDSTIFRNENWP